MTWQSYELDLRARRLVKDQGEQSIKESYKMREAVAYGLERFWGEHLRLEEKEPEKSAYWKATWDGLVDILSETEIHLPKHQNVNAMADELWKLNRDDQQVALAVLTQFCNSLVWWTQRYK
ncbi:MAG: hypothetical protein KME42_25085 [Tildeniella nuda ZEHNDER 1965/U140]|jgi:hypothetical protein|nr:hypothetical protein [Tildeniella nuda ZEHNDER 1965/U140]